MVEKVIDLNDIELVGFLGIENKNIQEVETAFPKTKIISRGNKISIKGNKEQLLEVEKIIKSLMSHYHKFGKIDKKTVLSHINNGFSNEENESIVYGSSGKRIYAKTSNQKKIVDLHEKNDLLFVIGPAGTGKTYVSVALGVKALKEKKIKKIIITRPVVEAGENLGFLPGDLQDKIDPYLKPIYDALEDMIPVQKMKKFIENKTIEIAPLAYIEGYKHKFIKKTNGVNTVEIYPEDENKSYFKISFAILENDLLSSFTVFDKSNSVFIYTIDDFLEEELDNSLFSFEIENYPDIEVIDFR